MKSLTRLPWLALFASLFTLILASVAPAQATSPAAPAAPTIGPVVPHGTIAQRAQSLTGLAAFTLAAFVIGRLRGFRGRVPLRLIVWGVILQFAFGAIVLFAPSVLEVVQQAIQKLLDFSN